VEAFLGEGVAPPPPPPLGYGPGNKRMEINDGSQEAAAAASVRL